jgi:hypothetical protein
MLGHSEKSLDQHTMTLNYKPAGRTGGDRASCLRDHVARVLWFTSRNPLIRRLAVLSVVVLFIALPNITSAIDDIPPSFDEIIKLLELDPSIKEKALAGEIVTIDRENSMEKELAVTLIAVIKHPYGEVIDAVKGNRLFQFHKHVLDFAEIKGEPQVSKFQELGFTAGEIDEVHALLAAKPGDKFNLSAAEIGQLQTLQAETKGLDDAALIEAVNNLFRTFLTERLRHYQETGLGGIAPYRRGRKKISSPTIELNAAIQAVADMKRYAPNFYSIMQSFPEARIQKVEHRFYVFKFNIAERPGFVLSHRIYFFGAEFALAVERHIYVPHFYNSLQLIAGVVPHENSTVLFYGNRTYTDKVTGFARGIKQDVGGKRLAEALTALIIDIRDGIESGKASP